MNLNLEMVFGPKVTQNDFPLPLTGDVTLAASVNCQVDLGGAEVKLEAGKPTVAAVKDLAAIKCKANPLVVISVQFSDAISRLDATKTPPAVETAAKSSESAPSKPSRAALSGNQ